MPVRMPDIPALIQSIRPQRRTPEPDHDLFTDCGFDSLHRIELAHALEDTLHVEIGDDAIESWRFVRDVLDTVEVMAGRVVA